MIMPGAVKIRCRKDIKDSCPVTEATMHMEV